MELGAERHSVDHDRVVVGGVIEHDDLEEPARPVGSDDEVSAAAGHDAHGVADCVPDVFVSNSMLSRAVRDLHSDKATLSECAVKVALSTAVPAGDPQLGWRRLCSPASPLYDERVGPVRSTTPRAVGISAAKTVEADRSRSPEHPRL